MTKKIKTESNEIYRRRQTKNQLRKSLITDRGNLSPSQNEKISIDVGNPTFTIQLKKPEVAKGNELIKIPKQVLRVLFLFSLILSALLLIYIYPKNRVGPQTLSPNLRLSYVAPKYISVGDENIVEVSVINTSSSDYYNGIITLKFTNSALPIIATENKGLSIALEDLPPGGRITKSINFKIPIPAKTNTVEYYFEYTPSKENFQSVPKIDTFQIMPLPLIYFRTILNYALSIIGGSSLLGIIGSYIWDRIVKYFSSEDKANPDNQNGQASLRNAN